uniref:Uncharacterized protein MANES_04G049600 n=1 Tax=Rhizophora mucronata TaxID=61149 RepID=A0A2P2LQ90_RHIMU
MDESLGSKLDPAENPFSASNNGTSFFLSSSNPAMIN